MIWKSTEKRKTVHLSGNARRDVTLIYNYLSLTDVKDAAKAKELYNRFLFQYDLCSVTGEQFLARLADFAQGKAMAFEPCLLCDNPAANGVFCEDCMNELKDSRMEQIGSDPDE